MKKVVGLFLVFAMLIGFIGPGNIVFAGEEKEVTDKVTQSPPDVILKNAKWDNATNQYVDKYIIQDGVVVDDTIKPANGQFIEIVYKWSVPDMSGSGIKEGDYFLVDLPDLTYLKAAGFNPNEEQPIMVPKAGDPAEQESLGTAIVDTNAGHIKAKFNALAVAKQEITNGFFQLKFQATNHLNVTYNAAAPAGEDKIVITKRDVATQPLGTGQNSHKLLLDKRGAEYNYQPPTGGTELRLGWTVYVNYDQLVKYHETGELDERNNLWMEDRMSDSALKILEDYIYVYIDEFLATPEGKLSNYAYYTPNYRAGVSKAVKLVKSTGADADYDAFKARVQALPIDKEAITVYLYQAKDESDRDGLLICFGNINEREALSYDAYGDKVDSTLVGILDKFRNPTDGTDPRITEEQVVKTKELYGLDGDDTTPMKKAVAFRVFFHTLPKNDGKFANVANVSWDGGSAEPVAIMAKYAKFSAGAGYTDTTAAIVEKKWEGKVGGPVKVNLLQNGNPYKSVTLGVAAPANENEVKEWIHVFSKLPEKDSSGKLYTYSVEEVAVDGYETKYHPASRVAEAANSNKVVITNTFKKPTTVVYKVKKTWIGPATGDGRVEVALYGEDKTVALQVRMLTVTEPSATFDPVPIHNAAGKEIDYSLEERLLPENSKLVAIYKDYQKNEFEVINQNMERVDVSVVKKWIGEAPIKLVLYLTKNGVKDRNYRTELKADNDPELDWKANIKQILKYDDNGKLIDYSFEEELLPGYKLESMVKPTPYHVIITNINESTVNIKVEKKWVGPKANSVVVNLLESGNIIDSVELNEGNKWQHTFEKLYRNNQQTGEAYKYSITENAIPGYTAKITGDIDSGFVITNTYNTPLTPYVPYEPPTNTPPTNNPPTNNPPTNNPPTNNPPADNPPNPQTPPTTEIPDKPAPQGEPTVTQPDTTVPAPQTPIEDNTVPKGKTELPKTSGIPAGMMVLAGMGLAGLGGSLKRKRK